MTEAEPWLVAGLGHHDPLLRLACARALADLRATEALPRIMMALREVGADPVMFRRFWLPSARLGSRSCGRPATRILADGLPLERQLAAVALGYIGSHQALSELRSGLASQDDELVAAAARALGRVGDSKAAPLLIELLGGVRTWFVRVAAATALGALVDHGAARTGGRARER